MGPLTRGLYEQLITSELDRLLAELDPSLVSRGSIEPAEAHEVLARHLADLSRRALRAVGSDDSTGLVRQVTLANKIAEAIAALAPAEVAADDLVADSHDLLLAVAERAIQPGNVSFPERPAIPLTMGALLVNGREQPRIGNEVRRELASADRVDLLCAFVMWYGVRLLDGALQDFVKRGGRLRVITTTYAGATDQRAVDRLVELGAEVRVSYETHTTRLHAKAWLFERETGFSTAYVGSSNLSKAALVDGLEWNVRISAVEQPQILDAFRATFDEYWEDASFEPYNPARLADQTRLKEALLAERSGRADLPLEISTLEVRPYGFQQEVLDELQAVRAVQHRTRNLVVMATGTGKTIVAALDYRRLQEAGDVDSLLFVAHRDELLTQAQSVFRQVMRNGSFGERLIGGERPKQWRHVFASIQSLAQIDLTRDLAPDQFDMVIVDEFHHAMAPTYERLLKHLRPKQLVGLTATPERGDGQDVRDWFDGRTAVELRLWEALERGLLTPFQYFGVHDDTNLTAIRWTRRGYDESGLSNLYTGHDARVRLILQALRDAMPSVGRMRAIGFCVSIDHAEFMARKFNEAGIPSLAVTSRTPSGERHAALLALRNRDVNALFTVDLFNEGVDIPQIDTVLFLRPTESPTVFLQQLGRGLRLASDKPCLTALDFIGNQHAKFRFDLRFRALTGATRRQLSRDIAQGFPTLPAGCHIALDRVASDIVMSNVAAALQIDWKGLASELRQLGDVSLAEFLEKTGLDIDDIYRRRRGGWAGLRQDAGLETRAAGPQDARLAAAIGRILHIDDLERLTFLSEVITAERPPAPPELGTRRGRLFAMLHFSLWGSNEPLGNLGQSLKALWEHPSRRDELSELAKVLRSRLRHLTSPLDPTRSIPLQIHGRYSRDEALAAFGFINPSSMRQGITWFEEEQADVFFATLRRTEKHYSPTTMYVNRAISPRLFQWESQSTTSVESLTGQRYINHVARNSSVHLFVRETKESDGALGAPPYFYAGPATFVSHSGSRPMRIIWKLSHDLPPEVFRSARVAS